MPSNRDETKNSLALPLEGQPAAPRNQWMWDLLYPHLHHLARLGLVRSPKDDSELEDRIAAWEAQLTTGFKWQQSIPEERAIESAFRALANSCTEWPVPAAFWQVFRAPGTPSPHVDLGPRPPIELDAWALMIRDTFAKIPDKRMRVRAHTLVPCYLGQAQLPKHLRTEASVDPQAFLRGIAEGLGAPKDWRD